LGGGQIEPAFYIQDAVFDMHLDVSFLDTRHLKDDFQGVLRLVNVRRWHKDAHRNRALFLFVQLALLLYLQFLFRLHERAPHPYDMVPETGFQLILIVRGLSRSDRGMNKASREAVCSLYKL
jgi:hypothetical protein